MGLYYRLDYKNNKNYLNHKDSVPVIIDYYYKGKRTKVSTGVVCQIKDWDDNWRKKTSKEFELVLDPFMGSGTVGRVCDEVNRNFVGYDLKRYYWLFPLPLLFKVAARLSLFVTLFFTQAKNSKSSFWDKNEYDCTDNQVRHVRV